MFVRSVFNARSFARVHSYKVRQQCAGYQSQYSSENRYPAREEQLDQSAPLRELLQSKKAFSGYIPLDELKITYCKGLEQRYVQVNTKVELKFHVQSATWLSDAIKKNLISKKSAHIDKQGYLVVSSEKTNQQILNQADCFEKLRSLIYEVVDSMGSKTQQLTSSDPSKQQYRTTKTISKLLKEKKPMPAGT